MNITSANLMRWAGLSAMAAGLIFAGIQPIHPADEVSSVTTNAWAIITTLKTAMCFFFLLGIAGLYARQVPKAGWLGLGGFLMLSLSWWLQTGFVFTETFIFPLLASANPQFVDGTLGMVAGRSSEVSLGALPLLYGLVGIFYMLGGLLFGISIFRAGVLPRWAGALMAITAALTPTAALLPHHLQRLAAVPMGIAFLWLGYALWSERQANTAQRSAVSASMQLRQTATK